MECRTSFKLARVFERMDHKNAGKRAPDVGAITLVRQLGPDDRVGMTNVKISTRSRFLSPSNQHLPVSAKGVSLVFNSS